MLFKYFLNNLSLSCEKEHFLNLWRLLSEQHKDLLATLVNGKIKNCYSNHNKEILDLLIWGFATKFVIQGEHGYVAATDLGYSVYKASTR